MPELSVSKPTDVHKVTIDDDAPAGECDSNLVERFLAGSDEAFNRLVLRHQRRAINLAYRFLGNHEEACDVAQKAFVRVYRHLNRFKGDCSFRTRLCKIVLNLCRNKYRRKKGRCEFRGISIDNREKGDSHNCFEIPDSSLSVEREIRRKEIQFRIEESLSRLPRMHREILVLRHMEGLSYSEISILLGRAEGTTKSRLHRARTIIRKLLSDMVEG